ncbi:hypothetical protein VOLCADRAFT_108716 [Volvox carteri f. nagariensis]|uniref:Uncharacterized protein n=1 Tax=Volvox carteri f. nagariensis TaxID=3068 RepID=D8UM10_VOLCA|nr:uncharacterized protein VOLCADRAFT_108716 [Volvox carteri f. nagariensis]EFJ39239.1 hypothetical protein VOLCADRAFT_108716 [Volvox carteri f. nagariensis]|eukprot:XP_002959696.1 hypothetical protein VOLCADRAFT_108716 [Volvox carteri f. nagariensis]
MRGSAGKWKDAIEFVYCHTNYVLSKSALEYWRISQACLEKKKRAIMASIIRVAYVNAKAARFKILGSIPGEIPKFGGTRVSAQMAMAAPEAAVIAGKTIMGPAGCEPEGDYLEDLIGERLDDVIAEYGDTMATGGTGGGAYGMPDHETMCWANQQINVLELAVLAAGTPALTPITFVYTKTQQTFMHPCRAICSTFFECYKMMFDMNIKHVHTYKFLNGRYVGNGFVVPHPWEICAVSMAAKSDA